MHFPALTCMLLIERGRCCYSSVVDVWPSLFTIDIRNVAMKVRAAL